MDKTAFYLTPDVERPKKRIMKRAASLFFFFLFLVLFLMIFRNSLAKVLIEDGMQKALGVEIGIEDVELHFVPAQILLKNIRFGNPEGFPDGYSAVIPRIFLKAQAPLFLFGPWRFERVEAHFREIRLVKIAEGRLNLFSLKTLQKNPGKRANPSWGTDKLVLRLDRAVYTDLSGDSPRQKTYELKLKEGVYEDVDSIVTMFRIVAYEVIERLGSKKYLQNFKDIQKRYGKPTPGILDKVKEVIEVIPLLD